MSGMNPGGNFFAVIPAAVRYDADLPANAKLLYGEISALTNVEGYCWAGNTYFMELYNVSERSVVRWIEILCKKGYLKREIIRNAKKEVGERRLYVNIVPADDPPPDKNVTTSRQNCPNPPDKNVTTSRQNCPNPPDKIGGDNNTSIINTRESAHTRGELNNVMLSDDEIAKLSKRFGEAETSQYIDNLSLYIGQTGKKYKSHYAVLVNWMRRDNINTADVPTVPTMSLADRGADEWQ